MTSGEVNRDRHHLFSLCQGITQIFHDLIQNGEINLGNKPISLKNIYKLSGHYHSSIRFYPAHQCFRSHYFSGMKRYLRLEICMEFFIIIGAYHSGYNCSGILQISADLVRVNFYGTVYLLRLALFSGLIGIIHHGRYRPVILRDLIQTGGNDQITLIIPAVDPLHKRIRKRQVRLSGILHGIFLQHTDKVVGGYTAEQYAFLAFFL